MPLSANLSKLGSSILPRAKRATNRNNVATEKQIKKKVLAPDSPGAEMSSAETAAPKRTRPIIICYKLTWNSPITIFHVTGSLSYIFLAPINCVLFTELTIFIFKHIAKIIIWRCNADITWTSHGLQVTEVIVLIKCSLKLII